ncbi:ASCH domain-containing protein [Ancylomarina longa]|uniref:ASCH domain-containing protein n=1 Tax=Ancylomarina longa TaxID=2487017 RepID=A0A434AH17_9BACT|nr:ASCH domain-containing protein [Ancylomarina longa]RUT73623.1 ASCH domain-containing protein [Ancylomarina longa]
MTQIHFHEGFYTPIKEGIKTQTARVGEPVYPLGKAEAIFSDNKSLPIEITKVSHKTFNQLSKKEAEKDGFQSKQELWNILLKFYPKLEKTDILMLVEFRCI